MFSRFFIDRPIFASVLSIVTVLAGAIAYRTLPLAMYPPITPPTVQVDCTFPGASAEVVAESIATKIEQHVNGVEGMLYMSSQCTNDGTYTLTVTFEQGTNLNLAQVLVQNRVNLALPDMPEVVKQTGLRTRKKSPDILMTVNIFSPDLRHDQLHLSNYALMYVKDELSRVDGVGDISLLGQRDYSMRIWVDPEQIAHRSMNAGDVVKALRDQNIEVATGQIGQPPVGKDQVYQVPLKLLGRLAAIEQFKNIVLKSMPDGRIVRLKDVARLTLTARNELTSARVDKRPSVGLAIFQLPDANALDTADRVLELMKELKRGFPEGIDYQISYDTTPYTRETIGEVFKSLFDAVLLVAAVVLLFLQNWRSALIPLLCVPVSIIGTFAVMAVLGFTLNNLTLFGLVLAIGIVVDDAIVVIEAVEQHIAAGMLPSQATKRAMEQVTGPVIAVGLVLCAVFVPCAFISGITGQFFRQFAMTIAVSTIISTFTSLTLCPALAAILLQPRRLDAAETRGLFARRGAVLPRVAFVFFGAWLAWKYAAPHAAPWLETFLPLAEIEPALPWLVALVGAGLGFLIRRPLDWILGVSFALFNSAFRWITGIYTSAVGVALRGRVVILLVYPVLLGVTWWTFSHLPRGFIPSQDMGQLMINVQLPDAASMERTREVMNRVEEIVHEVPGTKHTSALTGQSLVLNANGSNFGSLFVMLDDFKNRRSPDLHSDAILAALRKRFDEEILEAQVSVVGPAPMRGVGRVGGFKLMIEDRGDQGPRALQGYVDNLVERGNNLAYDEHGFLVMPKKRKDKAPPGSQKALTGLFSVFRANVPSLYVDVDRSQAMAMQVPLKDAFDSMQIYLGSVYVNDFNLYGRTWQVIVQADSGHRDKIDDVRRLKVRNRKGEMVPLGAFATVREVNGPLVLTRYNMYPAAPITGNAGPGVSSGEALEMMQKLAESQLPASMSYEWTELAYLESRSGGTALIVILFAVVMVFLVLAAQYESWSLPLAVILVVPLCILCALAGVALARHDINIFTQVGFVVLVGLASKNAILIVEFAKHLREAGVERRAATLEACKLRLRPIVMTSLAFILGVLPLLVSRGAGAEMRRILGTAVFSGMLGVTLFGLFLTPVFFYVIDALSRTSAFRSPKMRLLGQILLFPAWLPVLLRRFSAALREARGRDGHTR